MAVSILCCGTLNLDDLMLLERRYPFTLHDAFRLVYLLGQWPDQGTPLIYVHISAPPPHFR